MTKLKTIGLALSGGGYKGLAHAGVLQFLQEQRIEPQIIAGTSAGAIVGSLYAYGKTPAEIVEFFRSVNLFNPNHFSFNKGSLLDTGSFLGYLDDIFGDLRLKDLPKELFICATDIQTGRAKIFEQEIKIKEAVAASCAYPGVFSPIQVESHLYSDGGILNNFPANILQGRCDFLIGVNLYPEISYKASSELSSMKAILSQTLNIMMANNSVTHNALCDWCIFPQNIEEYSTFELFKTRMQEIYQTGYRSAEQDFARIKYKLYSRT